MKKKLLILLCVLTICNPVPAQWQDEEIFQSIIAEALQLYESKEYLASARKYSEAFTAIKTTNFYKRQYDRAGERYDAACSWSLAGEADSAFFQLFIVARTGLFTPAIDDVIGDEDLAPLHNDSRWPGFVKVMKAAVEKFDRDLAAQLDTV